MIFDYSEKNRWRCNAATEAVSAGEDFAKEIRLHNCRIQVHAAGDCVIIKTKRHFGKGCVHEQTLQLRQETKRALISLLLQTEL